MVHDYRFSGINWHTIKVISLQLYTQILMGFYIVSATVHHPFFTVHSDLIPSDPPRIA